MPVTDAPIRVTAPAKLNLTLRIVGRRSDGYHELQTLFQLLDWGDDMVFVPNAGTPDGAAIHLKDNAGLPVQENLVWLAAHALLQGRPAPFPVAIELRKHVPAGGGLGGGSSDAATTLLILNHLWGLEYNTDDLATIGLSLGADVPVFVRGTSAWAEGTGERLTPVELPAAWYLIVHPGISVRTGAVFRHPGLTRNTQRTTIRRALEGGGRNDCEPVVRALYPAVDTMLKALNHFGEARLTGTGACGFVAFRSEAAARQAAQELSREYATHVACGINRSPVFGTLRSLPPSSSA